MTYMVVSLGHTKGPLKNRRKMKKLFLFPIVLFLISCSKELNVLLPNNYVWGGDRYGCGDVSYIVNEKAKVKIEYVLDIFVERDFVYGCFAPQCTYDKYFILNTSTNILQKFNDTTDYIKELKKKNLPFGFLERAVNILELRKGYKSDYWNANLHNQ